MKIDMKIGVSGIYKKIEILNSAGEVVRVHDGFCNLITDIGIANLYVAGNSFSVCRVGSGTATPAFTDTSLQNQIASTSSTTYSQGNNLAEGYCWAEVVYTFGLGSAAGNISEIGTGWHASNPNTLFSRARVLDANNNPTSITVLPDEILRVTWEHRRYWSTTDASGELTNAGNKGGSYSWVCRPMLVGEWRIGSGVSQSGLILNATTIGGSEGVTSRYTTDISNINSKPSGSPDMAMGRASLSPNGLRLSFNTSQGNGSTRSISFGTQRTATSGTFYQLQFNPDLVKTSNDLMEIDVFHTIVRR